MLNGDSICPQADQIKSLIDAFCIECEAVSFR